MLSLEQLREDLKEIRYYYARKEIFDSAVKTLGVNEMLAKADKYNRAARLAPPTLLDLYISLYLQNKTQVSLASDLGYSTEYVRTKHNELLEFLQAKLSEGGTAV